MSGIGYFRIIYVISALNHSLQQHFNDKEIVPDCGWGKAIIAGGREI